MCPGTVTTQPQNSYLQFPNTTDKYYLIFAGLPTIFAYPTQGKTYAQAIAESGNDVDAYAQALGKYAFNFLTNTEVNYEVTQNTFCDVTFKTTLQNPYNDSSMTNGDHTIMCLQPHQYQDQTFAPGLCPKVLDLGTDSKFF